MSSNLNASQLENAKAWLMEIFANAGAIPASADTRVFKMPRVSEFKDKAKELTDIILGPRLVRTAVFNKIDDLLNYFSTKKFVGSINAAGPFVIAPVKTLAAYIADFCASHKILWDNSTTAIPEQQQCLATVIGKALNSFNCYTTTFTKAVRQARAAKSTTSGQASTQATTSTAAGSVSSQPKAGFSGLGPLSGVATGIVNPGQKVQLGGSNSGWIFCIEGVNLIGASKAYLYVRPVTTNGDPTTINPLPVYGGTAKGYGYCPVFFDDASAADTFLVAFGNKGGAASDFQVVKAKAAGNGYFEVNTDLGKAYIAASKLNEDLVECELQEDQPKSDLEKEYDDLLETLGDEAGNYNIITIEDADAAQQYVDDFKYGN